ncbi:MAG: hypothetical protein FWD41_00765, partial [Actinomycetia bacterium]|nr:hypothetical protein [Actinomycetes bacterium]
TATRKVLLYEIGGLAKGKTHELMLVNTNLSYAPKPATFVVDRFVVVDGKILDGAGPAKAAPLSAPVPSMAPLLEVPDDDMPDISNEETSAQ